ncbi:MAG: hypothetical protein EXR09_04760 [Acetobacteraceae bacterium]|nr:hypothetical protein [Acetobacteraceae bacterium]
MHGEFGVSYRLACPVATLIAERLPTFLIGILLILCFGVGLGWLPSFGRSEVVRTEDWWSTGFLTWGGPPGPRPRA